MAGAVAGVSVLWLAGQTGVGLAAWALQAGLIVPLAWRRRFPVAVFAVIAVVALVQWSVGTELLADVALLVSLYTVASQRPRAEAVAAALVVEAGAVMASVRWALADSWLRSLVFLSGMAAAAFLLGTNLRSRRARLVTLTERAERLERERDQQALIAAAAERSRIAREMHDVIAHSLAVMISLADGANAKLRSDPERAAAAITNVSEIGRQALGDTRHLLGVLRADKAATGLAPQPGVAQLGELLDQVRATGLAASLTMDGEPRPLPPGTELTIYRVVQEATTNAVKHAAGATRIDVHLNYGRSWLGISVRDDGRPTRSAPPGPSLAGSGATSAGHGLAGMRERAAAYGGTVSAGPDEHGWTVSARLRVTAAQAPVPAPEPAHRPATGVAKPVPAP
jgi:signal transduction histidine kinase